MCPDHPTTPSPLPASLARIGDFTIRGEIGRGGMGVVYEAVQTGVDRPVALKVLPAALGAEAVARFEREARTAGALKHPGIVPVFAVGEDAGLHYIAMEFVEGPTLEELIAAAALRRRGPGGAASGGRGTRRGASAHTSPVPGDPIRTARPDNRLFLARAAELFAGAARALAEAHAAGVVHRDVKPSNLILDPAGRLRVLDFGLARAADMGRITHTGETIGTPRYMSPELINPRRHQPDARVDVYSLGVSLYETLTQQPAFDGESTEAVLLDVLNREPRSPRAINPAIPRDLETIVLRAMAKQPGDRYADAAALAEDLERFVQGLAPRARRMGPVTRSTRWVGRHKTATAVGALMILVLALLVLWVARNRRDEAHARFESLLTWGQRYLAHDIDTAENDLNPTDMVVEARERFDAAAKILPRRPEPWFYRAICQIELGREDAARTDLEHTLAVAPGFHAARALLADLLRRAGRTDEAARMHVELAAAGGAQNPQVLFYEGQARLFARDAHGALDAFSRALESRFDDSYLRYRVFLGRGDAALLLGDRVQALEDYSAARTVRGGTPVVMLRLARLHLVEGRGEKANLCLAAVAPDDERRHEPFLAVAALFEELGRRREALTWVGRAAKRAPREGAVLLARAALLLRLGKADEALAAADEALEYAGPSAAARELRGRALLARGRVEEAVAELELAVRLAPENHRARRWLAAALNRKGRWNRALVAGRLAVQLAPRDHDANIQYADTLMRDGKTRLALAQIKKAFAHEQAPQRHAPRRRTATVRCEVKSVGDVEPEGKLALAAPAALAKKSERSKSAKVTPDRKNRGGASRARRLVGSGSRGKNSLVRRIVRQVKMAEEQGNHPRAARHADFLVVCGVDDARRHVIRLARDAVHEQRAREVLPTIARAAGHWPHDLELAYWLGRCSLESSDLERFNAVLRGLEACKTARGPAALSRARLLARAGRLEAAREALNVARQAGVSAAEKPQEIPDLKPLFAPQSR